MIKQINFQDFRDAFNNMGRENNFTHEGQRALFDYLESFAESTGEHVVLDVIALCCDYTEYKNFQEVQENYTNINDIDELRDHTVVIEFDGGIIIQNF